MALLRMSVFSQSLSKNADINLIVPDCDPPSTGYQVMYLLHGYAGDCSDWSRMSLIERYVSDTQVVVVMPSCGNGFYTDAVHGEKYWSFLSAELPELISRYFPVSKRREDTFAVGLSMGGYGAVKLGLRFPHRYGYVASFSGVLDISKVRQMWTENPELVPNCNTVPDFYAIFGEEEAFTGSQDNLFALIDSVPPDCRPQIALLCGNHDFLLEINRNFYQTMQAAGLPCRYREFEGGHDWTFWNTSLAETIHWLPLIKKK